MKPTTEILIGNVDENLEALPPGRFQTCITSPPYWNLRDYGVAGQIGLEPTPELFIERLVGVFQKIRRVLRDDGTLWVNLGDTYARSDSKGTRCDGNRVVPVEFDKVSNVPPGLKEGDLCNMPHRLAGALQADGWFWRSTIIWFKRSPMPESITGWRWVRHRIKSGRRVPAKAAPQGWDMSATGRHDLDLSGDKRKQEKTVAEWIDCPGCDKCTPNGGLILRCGRWRPTTAHEYFFLFSKSKDYFADGEAIKEMAVTASMKGYKRVQATKLGDAGENRVNASFDATGLVEKKNPRSVWRLSSESYKGAHFATFPSELVRRALEATTSAAGACPRCGTAYSPVVDSDRVPTRPGTTSKVPQVSPHPDSPYHKQEGMICGNRDPARHIARTVIAGYRQSCDCEPAEPVPQHVLEPFCGSGTTLQVARHYGRSSVGIELNPKYAEQAHKRIAKTPICAIRRARVNGKSASTFKAADNQTELF